MKMQKLRELALKVPRIKGQHRLVAAAYDKKGNLLSVGYNSYTKSHPKQAAVAKRAGLPLKEYLHAEVASLIRCKETPYSLYVCRIDAKGSITNASPCPVCQLAMKEAGVKYYVSSYDEETSLINYL